MLDTQSPLISEFLKDHQQMSQLIYAIVQLLEADQLEAAKRRAKELDLVAGPHIAYEECELYPRLVALGAIRVSKEKLVGEHHQVRDSIRILVENEQLPADLLKDVLAGFKKGLEHASHCGTLISMMSRLSDDEQKKSLDLLLELRETGQAWTQLESNNSSTE